MSIFILSELKKMGYTNVYEEAPNGTKKMSNIAGKIYILNTKNSFGKLTITIDITKSEENIIKKIDELNNFIKLYTTNKNIILTTDFYKKINDTTFEIICRCGSENINLRKPYKIPINDITGFKNYEAFITLSVGLYLFEHTSPQNGLSRCKIISVTIPYNQIIYNKYMIGEDLKKIEIINENKQLENNNHQFKKKSDLTNQILDIIRNNK